MKLDRLFACLARVGLRGLLVISLLALALPALAEVEVSAVPASFSKGARIKVNATGLAISTNYRLRLEEARPGTAEFDLLDFSSGTASSKIVSVTIPAALPGNYEIVLYRNQLGLTLLAKSPVTVGPTPTITLTPNTGAPGRKIGIAVGNLVNGTLRVTYAGATILGPVPVGTTYSGAFLVPSNTGTGTVPVVVENMVGRLVARRAMIDFQALAPTGLPRLGFGQPQVPPGQLTPRGNFTIGGVLSDSYSQPPTGTQNLYFIGGGVTVPMDSSSSVGSNGNLQLQARTPDAYLDGITNYADRPGELVLVNQGVDAYTGIRRNGRYATAGNGLQGVIDGRDANGGNLTIIVRGYQPGGGGPLLQGVVIEAEADYRAYFSDADQNNSQAGLDGHQLYQSSMANQFDDVHVFNQTPYLASGYGCPTTFFRRTTNAQGRAVFSVDAQEIADVNAIRIARDFFSCNIPPCNSSTASTQSPEGDYNALTTFVMNIYAGQLGYRTTGIGIGYNGDTGEFFNITDGTPFVNGTTEVVLEPSADDDFDLRHLSISGIGPPTHRSGNCPGAADICYDEPMPFHSMTSYPSEERWPNGLFDTFDNTRVARLEIDTTLYGPVTYGRIKIGDTAWAQFNPSGSPPVCLLEADPEAGEGKIEYLAPLPDLTRLPTGIINGIVELRFGFQDTRSFAFDLYTHEPVVDVHTPNLENLRINARAESITGKYPEVEVDIPVRSPGHDVGRLDSNSKNNGTFDLRRGGNNPFQNHLDSTSENKVAANPGGLKPVEGAFFGFTDVSNTVVDPITLFDTGIIPLFRYTFGLDPIAGATIGADFWLASTLAFYGQLLPLGMNATIDPKLAGGVNLTFDLSILFGLVSGSISAESELSIAMRSRINLGGFAHLEGNPSPAPGKCFTFDLDGVWEACAVGICGGDRENLIAVREPHGCANAVADDIPLYLRRSYGLDPSEDPQGQTNFDLPRPHYTATAIGGDNRGHAVTIGVRDNGDVIATHVTGGIIEATRTIAIRTVAVQDVDVAFYAPDRALAIWSENSRSEAEITALMQSQRGRAFDDLARTQNLRFSYWDGHAWSTPANLTNAGSDGRPQLAGCMPSPRFLQSDCPTNGEITAVWEHERNGNLDDPDIEIWSSKWVPGTHGWSAAQRVSDTGFSSDMLPSVDYRLGVPVVAWARNPNGAFVDLNQRHVAYRFLDGSAQVNATHLGLAVGWVDIGVSAANGVVIAMTRAQDPEGFVGNRQALYAARASTCSAGICSFLVTEIQDPNGRQIRVERPRVAFDETDTPLIAFRGLAFGPDAQGHSSRPGDLPGFLLGTGELAMVHVHSFAQQLYTAQVVGLSDNGLQHWKPDVLFDETMGGMLVVSMQAEAPVGQRTPLEFARMYSPNGAAVLPTANELGDGAMLRIAAGGPDFEIQNALLSRTVIDSGQSVSLTLDLVNVGAPYVSADHGPITVVASLNGPAGSVPELTHFTLASNATTNSVHPVTFTITVPTSVESDVLQTIFLDIVAGEDANANDGSADHARIEVNAMPIPTLLNVALRPDTNLVNLIWADPGDSRVYGWRIWRLDADGQWKHLGSTRVPGYVDITSPFGVSQSYRVASYSANGMESEPSASITSSPEFDLVDLDRIFADSFDGVSP